MHAGFLPLDEVQREFVRLALKWENALPNTKYCLKVRYEEPAQGGALTVRLMGVVARPNQALAIVRQMLTGGHGHCALQEMADTPPSFLGRCGGVRTLVGHEANTAITRAKDAASLCALLGLSAASPHEVCAHVYKENVVRLVCTVCVCVGAYACASARRDHALQRYYRTHICSRQPS